MNRTSERKEKEKENRRSEILKAAMKLMKKNGLHGLHMDQVAEETALAKGTLYLYFKSKEEIIATLTVKARKLLYKEFMKVDEMDLDPLQKLREIILVNYQFYRKNPLYYDLVSLYEANHTLDETDEMYASSSEINTLVAKIATQAKNEGKLNPNLEPLTFTMILWGMTVGILQLLKVRGPLIQKKLHITENQILETYLNTIFSGLEKK